MDLFLNSFVCCLVPVHLLLSNMPVLYYVNRELKNHNDDFVDDDQKWVTVYCASATSKFGHCGVVDDAKQSTITSSCNPQASAGINPLF